MLGSGEQGAVVHGALLMGYVAGTIGANCPGAVVASQQVSYQILLPLGIGSFRLNSRFFVYIDSNLYSA